LIGAQNDVRGYLLTGDPEFIKSYESRRKEADKEMADLKGLVSDNPEQSIRAEDINQAKNTWYQHGDTMIAHRAQELPTNADWVKMGRTLLDDLTMKFDRFTDAEIILRDARLHKVRVMKSVLAYAGGALVVLLAVIVAYQVRKQMTRLAEEYRSALETIEHRNAALVRSESDLEEQKEWLRVTLTSIGDGVIVTNPEGRIVLMNHESERLTGWTQGEALHQPLATVFKIVNEETRAAVADPVAKVLQVKKVVGLANHTVLISRNGEERPIEDSAAPISDPKGKILGVVMVFHDASVMRQAQKNLKAYSADLEKRVADRTTTLQQMVSELEAFSYTVSHDLRSPLRAMQGFSEAVMEDYADKLDEQGRDYLGRIKNAATRLDRLIQDLLSYTRISRQEAPLEAFDLNQIVPDIIEHDASLHPPRAKVTVEGKLPRVLGRETALNQVITNLLGNAIKFVKPGTVPEIKIRAEDHGALARLWVEDNGIGIAPSDQERIFEMFIQLNEPQLYRGTGVGLAIVKKAAQTMRGAVGVESKEGEGSRFWVDLNKVA
jgi:PAS domain S-box-containing protein